MIIVKKLAAFRNLFSNNLSEPDGDGDYYTLPDWKYAFSIWGGKRSDEFDIRQYRKHFLRKEAEVVEKRWHMLATDYNAEGIGVQVAPDIWENTYVFPEELPIEGLQCTPNCNRCCCFDFGRVPILRKEFDSLPSRKWTPFSDKCPWACRGGCSIYKNRPFVCRIWHCQGVAPGGDKAYKDYLGRCHREGAVVINSGVRGFGCKESEFYSKDWKLL